MPQREGGERSLWLWESCLFIRIGNDDIMDALPGLDSPSLLNPEKAGLPWNSSFLISPSPGFFFSSLDFSLREGGRGVHLEGWEFAKGVKGAPLRRFTGEVDLYLCLLSELPYTQGKVDGSNWKLVQ